MNNNHSNDLDHSFFDKMIEPFYQDIKKYCFSLTSTSWEAEDLFQDTLIKIYLALKEDPYRQLTKRFFYRIAQNTWIDQKRKKSLPTESMTKHELYISNKGDESCQFMVRETLEILAEYLSIKQFVIVLLMDVFQFTAKETAGMIRDTESNVYTALHRSRKRLNRYVHLSLDSTPKLNRLIQQPNVKKMSSNLFESFMEGFYTKNAKLIYEAYLSCAGEGIRIAEIKKQGTSLCFKFTDPDGNMFMICQALD